MKENASKEDFYNEFSNLKEEIKSKENSLERNNKDKEENLLKLFGNNINERKPKYYGKTKSFLFFHEIPILILGEDSKF